MPYIYHGMERNGERFSFCKNRYWFFRDLKLSVPSPLFAEVYRFIPSRFDLLLLAEMTGCSKIKHTKHDITRPNSALSYLACSSAVNRATQDLC